MPHFSWDSLQTLTCQVACLPLSDSSSDAFTICSAFANLQRPIFLGIHPKLWLAKWHVFLYQTLHLMHSPLPCTTDKRSLVNWIPHFFPQKKTKKKAFMTNFGSILFVYFYRVVIAILEVHWGLFDILSKNITVYDLLLSSCSQFRDEDLVKYFWIA